MKRFTMATVLACILSVSALAGDIPCDVTPPPPPPPPPGASLMSSSTSPGDIPTGGVVGEIPTGGFAQQAEDALLSGFLAVVIWLT